MEITPDHIVLFQWGAFHLNATIAYTWALMALLLFAAWFATHHIHPGAPSSRWPHVLAEIGRAHV